MTQEWGKKNKREQYSCYKEFAYGAGAFRESGVKKVFLNMEKNNGIFVLWWK